MKEPRAKILGPCNTFPAPSPRPTALHTAQPSAKVCGPPGANPNPRSPPLGALPKGPGAAKLGYGDCQARVPDSPCHQATTWANRAPPLIQDGRKGRALRTPGNIRRPRAKTLGPKLPVPIVLISSHHSACPTAIGSCLRASCGLTLTLGRPQMFPSQGAGAGTLGLGTAKPQCQTHHVAMPPHGPIGALWLIQDGRKRRALRALAIFEGTLR